MGEHALLSASSAERWLICTAAPRFEEAFPETKTFYTDEGSLAHEICELKVLKTFTTALSRRKYTAELNKLKKMPLYSEEMERTSDIYIECLTEIAMAYNTPHIVRAETRVDFSDYAPDGFGTCDCIMIGGDTLNIADYKHGKGTPVSAKGNAQTRLYALGALKEYAPFYEGLIRQVHMTIIQPRVRDAPDSETLTVEELKAWGESIKPLALAAFIGFGAFVPGTHCQFCRGEAQCRARAATNTALEDFKDCLLPTAQNLERVEEDGIPTQNILTLAEIGDLLTRGKCLVQWYKALEAFAKEAILKGESVPGWKVVAGKGSRIFTDHAAAAAAVIAAGYDEALVYERKPKPLTGLEELMGKKDFAEKIGPFIRRTPGGPTLVTASDTREPYNSAAADFSGVVDIAQAEVEKTFTLRK